jgi:hypothetical protein
MVQNDSFDAARLEGRTEGDQDKALEIAKKMKDAGMSDSDITDMTGIQL